MYLCVVEMLARYREKAKRDRNHVAGLQCKSQIAGEASPAPSYRRFSSVAEL
jgi:hypothetical protein